MRSNQATPKRVRGRPPSRRVAPAVSRRRLASWLAVAVCLCAWAGPSRAQTPTSSLLRGEVRSAEGDSLADVRVAVEDVRTGIVHDVRTDRAGRFEFRLLPPGDYVVTAERLGYRPQRVTGVPLRPGRTLDMRLEIAAAEPPIMTVDSVAYSGEGAGWSRAGSSRWFGELELGAPRDRQSGPALALLSSTATDGFSVEGLPASLSLYAIEGFAFEPVPGRAHPNSPPSLPHALAGMDGAELVTQLADVQWAGAGGGQLFTYGRRGTRGFALRSWGTGTESDFLLGRFTPDVAGSYDLARAGAELSGPLIPDTAVFLVGGEWRRRASIQARAWPVDDPTAARVARSAREADGATLAALTLPFVGVDEEISAWGRFDWRVADGQDLTGFADVSVQPAPAPTSPLRATPTTPAGGAALDAVGGAVIRSILSPRFANELRAGLIRSTREYGLPGDRDLRGFATGGTPATTLVGGGLSFGAGTLLPSTVERTAFHVEQALLVGLGSHLLKVGVGADWESRDQVYAFARAGAFTFGGASGFEARTGLFEQSVGSVPSASFSRFRTALFIQDTWRAAPGLELSAGLRVVDERLPEEGVTFDRDWLLLSGLRNDSIDTRILQVAPRVGFRWNVRERNRWVVRAGFGLYHDDVAPELLAERMTHDGAVRIRRAFGDLGRWPATPDSSVAPVRGPALTLFGPEFRPPRSTRASFGVSRIGVTSIHLSTSYRHTDFLPRRRDLNLIPSASAHDQHGRPIFGELRQDGALLAVEPGSNRRFDAFDIVSAIEATAFSDYVDATVLVERRLARHLRLAASYTWSRTRDDWLAHPGATPSDAFAPRLGEAAADDDWAEGVSDFDVPHRFALSSELELPLPLRPLLGAVYRVHSGLPFTPGFQYGVDANGDYASNDPAFVDAAIPGMEVLLEERDCLRDQVGGFAARNSCRGETLQFLDARAELALGSRAGSHARLYFDALNLLGTAAGRPDRALYLVDAERDLERQDGTATLTVPLSVNPDFGRPLRTLESPRVYRIGMEVSF